MSDVVIVEQAYAVIELVDLDSSTVVEVATIPLGDGMEALQIAHEVQVEMDAFIELYAGTVVIPHTSAFPPSGTPLGTVVYQRVS